MPNTDSCEPQIVRAFEKAFWEVLNRPYSIHLENTKYVFADLRLQQMNGKRQIIVVEVKCFVDKRSILDEFYRAVGQYQLYQNALKLNQLDTPIYLAVPEHVYQEFFGIVVVKQMIDTLHIKLVVVNLDSEEISAWVD